MRILLLVLIVLTGWCGDDRVRTLGPYTVDQQKAFDHVQVAKEAIILMDQGIVIHLALIAERVDVEALARDEAAPPELRKQLKPVVTPLKRDGLEGKRITVAFPDDDAGEAVVELGILGKDGAWVHWEINATRKAYDAQAKTIAAMIASIR